MKGGISLTPSVILGLSSSISLKDKSKSRVELTFLRSNFLSNNE